MSSSEDDLDMYPPKFFDIGAVPTDVDTHSVPTSGLDYLRQVRLELSRCPEVVRVEIDKNKMAKKQPMVSLSCNYLTPAPPGLAPSKKWQQDQIKEFSSVRSEVMREKPSMLKSLSKKEFPNIRDIAAWRSFCLGDTANDTDDQGASSSSKATHDRKTRRSESKGAPPLLSSLIFLVQPEIEILLSHHLQWLRKYGFSDQQGRWIYSLMACMEKPLTPNACDVLRKLASACSDLRSKLKSKDDPSLNGLNLIICLVANYFDQKDMKDVPNVVDEDSNSSDMEEDSCDEADSESDEGDE